MCPGLSPDWASGERCLKVARAIKAKLLLHVNVDSSSIVVHTHWKSGDHTDEV